MAETATTTADTKEAEIGPMENFLKNNIKTVDRDLPKLLAAIKDKFKKRKWPQKDNKKSFKCLDLLLEILGGDNKKDVLMDYLNTATRKSMKETIKKNDPDAYDVKENIKLMLEDCRKQTNASQTDPIVNSVRINLLKLLNGAKGQGRKKLLEDGFAFGTNTWAKAYDDVIENGMAVYKQPISVQGRSSVSVNLKSKIHDHVMNSENDYIKLENHPPGYPTTTRTNWKFAELDVKDADPANCQGLANSRTLHSTLQSESSNVLAAPTSALTLAFANPNSKPGPKRPREDDCKIKAMWSQDDLAKGTKHSFWVGKYREVQLECQAHGVSQSGSFKQMLDRLRSHCKEVHPIATRQARLDSFSNFFTPKMP